MRGRKKKDQFADLDSDYKDSIANMAPEAIRERVCKVALDIEELLKLKQEDQALAEAMEAAKDAGAVYRDGLKMNRLRIRFAKMVLEDKGKL